MKHVFAVACPDTQVTGHGESTVYYRITLNDYFGNATKVTLYDSFQKAQAALEKVPGGKVFVLDVE